MAWSPKQKCSATTCAMQVGGRQPRRGGLQRTRTYEPAGTPRALPPPENREALIGSKRMATSDTESLTSDDAEPARRNRAKVLLYLLHSLAEPCAREAPHHAPGNISLGRKSRAHHDNDKALNNSKHVMKPAPCKDRHMG